MANPFKRIDMFAALDDQALDKLQRVAAPVRYTDGAFILWEGQADAPVLFLSSGAARVFRTNPDGREQNLILLSAGAGINLPTAFAAEATAPASAVAVGEVELLSIPLDAFRRVASETPSIALAVLSDLATKLRHLAQLTHDLSLHSVRGRLAQFLLNQVDAVDDSPVRWTHEAIAAQIGTVREVVSRTMRAFVKEGMIKMNRQRIQIINLTALRETARD